LYGSRCVSLMSLGEAFPRFSTMRVLAKKASF
jgi:hypothetical protein